MRLLNICAFFIFLFIAASCSDVSQDMKKLNENRSLLIKENAKNISDLSFVKSANYIFLENKHLVGKVKKIFFNNNDVIIWDNLRDNIAIFDMNGKFKFTIDKKGKGPKEYTTIKDVCFNRMKNEIIILDRKIIIAYSGSTGEYLYSKKIDFAPMSVASDGKNLYYYNPFTFNYKEKDYKFSLIKTNNSNEIIDKLFEVKDDLGNFTYLPSFQRGFGTGLDLMFVNRFDLNIYDLSRGITYDLKFEGNEGYDKVIESAISEKSTVLLDESPYVTSISKVVNNKTIGFLNYRKNGNFKFLFFDKLTGEVFIHGDSFRIFSEELLKAEGFIFDLPITATENSFVSVIDAFKLVELLPLFQKYEGQICDFESLSCLHYDDNPIIAFYDIDFK